LFLVERDRKAAQTAHDPDKAARFGRGTF
jgi:hypothetical protein